MVISLDKLIRKYNLKIRGVIHIGAHYGEEYPMYKKAGIVNLLFFEPVRSNFDEMVRRLPVNKEGLRLINMALGDKTGTIDVYLDVTNGGQSSSILEPYTHLTLHPWVKFEGKEEVKIDKLDNISFARQRYNMINIDVQGYELEVFKGAVDTLDYIDIIYSEVNRNEVYRNCARVEEIDFFLSEWRFTRVETDWTGGEWGDALYLKKY